MVGGAGDGAGAFKEHEGTGMGEGEGAKDVSDKIENEDQLLGAQQKGEEEQKVGYLHQTVAACLLETPMGRVLFCLTMLRAI